MVIRSRPQFHHSLPTNIHGKRNGSPTDRDETVFGPKCVSELFNDYFSGLANGVVFDDSVELAKEAILKHCTYHNISKIKQNRHTNKEFDFQTINEVDVQRKLGNINIKRPLAMIIFQRRSCVLSTQNLLQLRTYLTYLSHLGIFLASCNVRNSFLSLRMMITRDEKIIALIMYGQESLLHDQPMEYIYEQFNVFYVPFERSIVVSYFWSKWLTTEWRH